MADDPVERAAATARQVFALACERSVILGDEDGADELFQAAHTVTVLLRPYARSADQDDIGYEVSPDEDELEAVLRSEA